MTAKKFTVTTKNQWFQRADVIKRNRQKRWQHKQFLVEGVRAINQLRQAPAWKVEALLYTPEKRLSGWAQDVLREIECPYHLELSSTLLQELSDKEETSEVLAIVNMPEIDTDGAGIDIGPNSLLVLLDRPGNPGNLGSIMRSCDAFGVDHLLLTGHGVDPFDPVTIRATAGAFFSVPLIRFTSNERLAEWLARARQMMPALQLIGTSAQGALPLTQCNFIHPTLLLFGNETMGLSSWLKEQCDALAQISMQGVASSLNLACAVTAVLFEVYRQRGEIF